MYKVISLQDIFQYIGNTIYNFLNGIWTFDLSNELFLKFLIFGIVLIFSHSGLDWLVEQLKNKKINIYPVKKTPITHSQKNWIMIIWSYLITCLIVLYLEIGY